MQRVRLIHWREAEAAARVQQLRACGYDVTATHEQMAPAVLRAIGEDPPDAIVIDLGRLPSQGRDAAASLRCHKATRAIPLVFAGGDPEKVARVRELLPDAAYAPWDQIGQALAAAIAHPPLAPVVPASSMAGYAGAPLLKKLGIKSGSRVALIGAPQGFEQTLGPLPEGATITTAANGPIDIMLWFVTSHAELVGGIAEMSAFASGGGLWIIWPKQASGVASDLTQTTVQKAGLAASLVDFKVCAVDETWSGLRFTQRKSS